jgi:hypothetical protein
MVDYSLEELRIQFDLLHDKVQDMRHHEHTPSWVLDRLDDLTDSFFEINDGSYVKCVLDPACTCLLMPPSVNRLSSAN